MSLPNNILFSINDSLLFNCLFGFSLLILNMFIIITYKVDLTKQIQNVFFSENYFYRTFFQVISSILYSLIYIYLLIPKGTLPLYSIQTCGSFLNFALVFAIIIGFSKKKILINIPFFNKIMLTIWFIINISRFAMVNLSCGIISLIIFILGLKIYYGLFKQINQMDFAGEFNLNSSNFSWIVKIFKTLFMPLEFIFDYSIIPFNAGNKPFLLSYRIRAFIGPLLNTFFLLIYWQFRISLFSFCSLLSVSICLSLFFSVYSRNTKLENLILFYSYVVTFIYLFCIAKEQIKIIVNLSRILSIEQNKIFTWYLPPLYSLSGVICAVKSYKNGLRKISLISVFLEYFSNAVINFVMSLKICFINGKLFVTDKIILLGYLMHNCLIFIWMCHTNAMKGRLCKEISLMLLFLVFSNYCFLYYLL